MRITVIAEDRTVTFEAEKGVNFLRLFSAHDIRLPARCGGNGTCGKCGIQIVSGAVSGAQPDADGRVLACRARPEGDCVVRVREERGGGLAGFAFSRRPAPALRGWGVALDVGTTTLAACLVRPGDAKIVARASCLNPQAVFGSDVISRIRACAQPENLQKQHRLVVERTAELVRGLAVQAGLTRVSRMVVAGNATMLHLFCGEDPSSIGVAPFRANFLEEREYSGVRQGLPADRVLLMPSVSSYVGADITADIVAADMFRSDERVLLVDLGTNGEMALRAPDGLVCTSTAAGPALEGACIECGMGGVEGAVDHVRDEEGELRFTTVGGAPPTGLCGSGLVDFVACLLRRGEIDETGAMRRDRVYLTDRVYLSQADVRQFQLAKSAVSAGMKALLRRAGVREEEVSRLLIAGGLGFYIDVRRAAETGLILPALAGRAQAMGNGSLYGAYLVLADETCRAEARRAASAGRTIDLSTDAVFSEDFIEGMFFA